MAEFIVELLIVVEADGFMDAEVLGERAAKLALQALTPRSAGKAKVVNVVVADVRPSDD